MFSRKNLHRSALGRTSCGMLLLCVVFCCLGLPRTADAQRSLPRLVNCGDLNGFATGEPGYELLSESQTPPDVSLAPAPLDTVHVAGNFPNYYGHYPPPSDVLCVDPDQLDKTHRMTALELADGTVLAIDNLQPDTLYRVRLEVGALYPWVDLVDPIYFEFYPSTSHDVRIEVQEPFNPGPVNWIPAAKNIRCTTSHDANTYETILAGIVPIWVLVRSDSNGILRIRLSIDSSDPLFFAGFELHEHEPLPIVYKSSGGSSLQAYTPGVVPFVNSLNAGNHAGAKKQAFAIVDEFERGVALTHLVGWLDGSRDNGFHLIKWARRALTSSLPTHPGAAWLLDELDSFQRALDHLSASGYKWAYAPPEEGGMGFLNPDCESQLVSISDLTPTNANAHIAIRELRGITAAVSNDSLLQDLADWNLGNLPEGEWEPSPLVFAALKLVGSAMVDMNPMLNVNQSDPHSVALEQDRKNIFMNFTGLGFAAADFPSDMELILYDAYVTSGEHPNKWDLVDIENLFTSAQIKSSWWGQEVALLRDDPTAPPWANLQRNQTRISRNILKYWFTERLEHCELGGGWGDDVELMGQFSKMLGGRQDQADRCTLDALDDMIRYGFYETGGEVVDGYYGGEMTDVEHSGEYTTDPYITASAIHGHTACCAETALGVAKHILYSTNPTKAFAGPTSLGRLHFKSYYFTTNGPDSDPEHQIDILLNGRAVYPATATCFEAPLDPSHPMIADLTSWAEAWRDDAADTTGGKPAGWHGPVQWPSNQFGKNGYWWTHKGNSSDKSLFTTGLHSFTLELLRMAYHRSQDHDRWEHLIPAVRMFRAVKDWEDAGMPQGLTGDNYWAAELFKSASRFGPLVILHVADLENDTDLNTEIDPLGGGSTYVDQDLIDRMKTWAEDEYLGQHGMIKYALREYEYAHGQNKAKLTSVFEGMYENAITYLRTMYPLLTKHVIHTDRVFLSHKGYGPGNLTAAACSTILTEGLAFHPLVRWRSRLGDGQDLAVQCNYREYESNIYSAFAYNFESGPMSTTVMLDKGLAPGEYLVEWGQASVDFDLFPSWATVYSQVVQKRGTAVPAVVDLEPGLNLVRVTRQGDPDQPAAGYDLAVDPPMLEISHGPGGFGMELKARIANAGRTASPQATLNLYASILNPDGSIMPITGQPEEVLVASQQVPSIAATTGWTLEELELSSSLSLGNTFDTILISGFGIQVRAEVVADGLEGDLFNNDQTRGWWGWAGSEVNVF